jgi:hypothetical protein
MIGSKLTLLPGAALSPEHVLAAERGRLDDTRVLLTVALNNDGTTRLSMSHGNYNDLTFMAAILQAYVTAELMGREG